MIKISLTKSKVEKGECKMKNRKRNTKAEFIFETTGCGNKILIRRKNIEKELLKKNVFLLIQRKQ